MMPGSDRLPVVLAYGTRPEAIKMAPVVSCLRASDKVEPVVVVSGQHREMLDQVHRLFNLVPDVDLDIFAHEQTLTTIATEALRGYGAYLATHPASAVVVQGDTTTALAAALAAFYAHIPVVHIEAGLRTNDRYSPYPEEVNRRLISQLADVHLAPTRSNRANLVSEGVAAAAVRVTGNTVIDALLAAVARCVSVGVPAIDQAIAARRPIVLVTAHRRESWGPRIEGIGRAIAAIADAAGDALVVLPAHRNPLVRRDLLAPLAGRRNVVVTEPLDYGPFSTLLASSAVVLTDSGGIQEEAPSLGKPVLVMRDTTERPEAVEAGTVALVGTDPATIVDRTLILLTDDDAHATMAHAVNPYGDGMAAPRVVASIEALLGVGDPLPEFHAGTWSLCAPEAVAAAAN